ncbi:hypothetical protein DBZ36_07900 [Alginatibacterium sediminis]|uniref:Uncharacterized protein n=1 Tax=Alginatibacterium sediminis TaxID=2164068 RepID=A0A420EI43_9ALTE|nr:hypothetical protein [Alginatibacterium sediminis]RKF20353.1 hypothetical protein DBZ36_07900 [Alginatibacterium sediminis]
MRLPPRKPAKIAKPDLVFAAFQAWATNNGEIHHAFTIRNIGNAAIEMGVQNQVSVQFYASLNMLLDPMDHDSYTGAGGSILRNSGQSQRLEPNQELDLYWQASGDGRVDYRLFSYSIGSITLADNHPNKNSEIVNNNVSVAAILLNS